MVRFCAGLSIFSALAVSLIVIPKLKINLTPLGTPEFDVSGLWIIIIIDLIVSSAIIGTTLNNGHERFRTGSILIILAIISSALGFILIQGGKELMLHPDVQNAPIIIFCCAFTDFSLTFCIILSWLYRRY